MTQYDTKQHSPVLLSVVQAIDMIMCHYKSFETLGRHNINKNTKIQKYCQGITCFSPHLIHEMKKYISLTRITTISLLNSNTYHYCFWCFFENIRKISETPDQAQSPSRASKTKDAYRQ